MTEPSGVTMNVPEEIVRAAVDKATEDWWERNKARLDKEVQRLADDVNKRQEELAKSVETIRERLEKQIGKILIAVGIVVICAVAGGVVAATFSPLTKAMDAVIKLQEAASHGHESVQKVTEAAASAQKQLATAQGDLTTKAAELSRLVDDYKTKLNELNTLLDAAKQRGPRPPST